MGENVFVGGVTDVSRFPAGRIVATVQVVEIWKGVEVPAEVGVTSGASGFGDPAHEFETGTRYLFFPSAQDGELHDGLCDPAREWEESFAAARPDAHAPAGAAATPAPTEPDDGATALPTGPVAAPPAERGGAPLLPWLVAGGLVMAGGALYLARRDTGRE